MITAARSGLLVAALCCCAALVGAEALGQENDAPEGDAATPPSGAAVLARVRIGRKAWRFDSTQPTFTLAQVSGEIEDIEIKCSEQEEQLQYEPDAEWTLPHDWSACRLRVGAARGTTFMLYEFE